MTRDIRSRRNAKICFSKFLVMSRVFYLFCAVWALTTGATIPKDDSDERFVEEYFKVQPHIFENKIVEAIEKLKDFLKNGDPQNGVSPLDPYYLAFQDFEFFIMDTALKGYFQNTTISDFSRFQVENVEFKLLPLHFKIDLFLDQFKVNGQYKMSGKIFNELSINGTGRFMAEAKNLTLFLYLKPTQVNSSLQIKDIIVEFKTINAKINYTNELIDNKIHELDENLALYVLDQAQIKYFPPLLNMVKVVLNHFLLGYSYSDILKIILEMLKK